MGNLFLTAFFPVLQALDSPPAAAPNIDVVLVFKRYPLCQQHWALVKPAGHQAAACGHYPVAGVFSPTAILPQDFTDEARVAGPANDLSDLTVTGNPSKRNQVDRI